MFSPFQRPAIGTAHHLNDRNQPADHEKHMPTPPSPEKDPLDALGLINLQRPAIANPDLTTAAQINQQINAIQNIAAYPVSVRLAIVSDVASGLPALHGILNSNHTSRALAAKTRKLIAVLNAVTIVEKENLKRALLFLSQTRLPDGMTRQDFVDYVDTLDNFIYLVRPFAKTVGLYDTWQDVVVSVLQQYFRILPDTGTGETPVNAIFHDMAPWDPWVEDEPFQPITPPNTTESSANTFLPVPSLGELSPTDDSLDEDVALETLQAIEVYLTEWIRLDPALYRTSATTWFDSLTAAVDTMKAIHSINSRILSSDYVHESLSTCVEKWTSLAHVWGPSAEDALAERLFLLIEPTRTSPTQIPEAIFSQIMDHIQALSHHPLSDTPSVVSTHEEEGVIGSKFSLRAKNFCNLLHHQWQTTTYQSELHQLWLLIWRSLKVLYKVKGRVPVDQSGDQWVIDNAFFDKPGISATFARLLKTSDAANPRSVEDMVAQYCRFIAKCRNDPDDKYDHLRRYKETELRPHIVTSLQQFIRTGHAKQNMLHKLHRAVVRFNFITKGPATVRRWTPGGMDLHWSIELLDLMSPTKAYAPGPSSPTFPPPEGDIRMIHNAPRTPTSNLVHPEGINIRSAFDYVYCPFPETRAHEVAQGALISRELQETGTFSDGLRIEDLVNIPPRHVRGPLNLSPFQWPDSVTPAEVISSVRNRVSQVRSRLLRRIRGTPTRKTDRVAKSPRPKQGVRLRGGAGSLTSPDHQRSRTPPRQRPRDQLMVEFRARLSLSTTHYTDEHVFFWLDRAGWDLKTAVMQFQCAFDFEYHSYFYSAHSPPSLNENPFLETILAFLEKHNWQEEDAQLDFSEQVMKFKENLDLPFEEIVLFFRETMDANEALAIREHQNVTKAFRAGIAPGDPISQEEIDYLLEKYEGQVGAAMDAHLEHRRVNAPCYICPELEGYLKVHHTCLCTADKPDFVAMARKKGFQFMDPSRCHRCPYFPSEFHHCRTPHRHLPGYQRRPERTRHKDDARPVLDVLDSDVFKERLAGFSLRREYNVAFLLGSNGFGAPRVDKREWRNGVGRAIEKIKIRTVKLRKLFVQSLSAHETMPMDEIPDHVQRRPETARRSTVQLCHRAAIDLQASQDRLVKMLSKRRADVEWYAVLSFRHELGRFIRTVNELRSLWLDFVLHNDFDAQDVPGMDFKDPPASDSNSSQSEDDDNDDQPPPGNEPRRRRPRGTDRDRSFSHDGLPQIDRQSSEDEEFGDSPTRIQPRRLPSKEEYDQMYIDELRQELTVERKVANDIVAQYPKKADLIELLMRLDRRGNHGYGARLGFHALKGYTNFTKDRRDSTWQKHWPMIVRNFKYLFKKELEKRRMTRWASRQRAEKQRRLRNEDRAHRRAEREEAGVSGAADWSDISSDEASASWTARNILKSADPGFGRGTVKLGDPSGGNEERGTSASNLAPTPAPADAVGSGGGQVHTATKPTGQPPRPLRKKLKRIADPPDTTEATGDDQDEQVPLAAAASISLGDVRRSAMAPAVIHSTTSGPNRRRRKAKAKTAPAKKIYMRLRPRK